MAIKRTSSNSLVNATKMSTGFSSAAFPTAPTIGTATTTGQTTATVAYTAAVLGATATSFTATSNPGSLTGTGSSPITISGLTASTNYTFTVTATNSNGTSPASAASNQITTDSLTYSVGSTGPAGGIVFYDAGSTQSWGRYLEAAPSDTTVDRLFSYPYTQGAGLSLPATLGSGYSNTIALASAGSGPANACRNLTTGGFTDWFMPDKSMMNTMYSLRATIGGFLLTGSGDSGGGGGWYLSSTYGGGDRQTCQYYVNGYNNNLFISDYTCRVRAVRAF